MPPRSPGGWPCASSMAAGFGTGSGSGSVRVANRSKSSRGTGCLRVDVSPCRSINGIGFLDRAILTSAAKLGENYYHYYYITGLLGWRPLAYDRRLL